MSDRRYYARTRAGKKQVVDREIGCVIADCTFRESAALIVRALNHFDAQGQPSAERPPRKRGSKVATAASAPSNEGRSEVSAS